MAVGVPAVPRPAPIARVGPVPDFLPRDRLGLDRATKLPVLEARPGQDGHKASAGAMDMIEVIVTAELGVGEVEEIGSPGDLLQSLPGIDVGNRIAGVAVGGAKLHRHAAIGGSGQNEQQLL